MKLHNRNWWLTENVSLLAFMVKVEAVFGIFELLRIYHIYLRDSQ